MKPSRAIPQMAPWFGAEEKAEILRYLDEGGWITEFRRTALFEQRIAEYTQTPHCVVVNNGTVSLTLAAIALGLRSGDEVLVPNYTMIATPNAVKMIGCTPVFVDVERDTLCMDVALAEEAITERTRALILVTANGRAPRVGVDQFEALCKRRGLLLIEDAAQSLGSRFPDGRHVGSVGSVGSFSFSAPKVISTGQGGALITRSSELAESLRRIKDFGRACGGNDVHDTIGFNFKFTELQACVGLAQFEKLPWRVERKKDIYRRYRDGLAGSETVQLFEQDLTCSTPWFIDVLVERRDALVAHLREKGIGTRTMYPPINEQKAYQLAGLYPVSQEVGAKGLWLPSSSQLTDEEVDYVCWEIRNFYRDAGGVRQA